MGAGGGMIVGPLLLELGMLPQVTAATGAFMVLFSSSLAVAQFALLNMIPLYTGELRAPRSFLPFPLPVFLEKNTGIDCSWRRRKFGRLPSRPSLIDAGPWMERMRMRIPFRLHKEARLCFKYSERQPLPYGFRSLGRNLPNIGSHPLFQMGSSNFEY